jgi:hypothetical protein
MYKASPNCRLVDSLDACPMVLFEVGSHETKHRIVEATSRDHRGDLNQCD